MTSTVEQRRDFTFGFTTHPMEAAWATEAIFFIAVEEVTGEAPSLTMKVQISPDGINWIDEGNALANITGTGNYFVRARHFGGWLRIRGDIDGRGACFNLTIHLTLKE